MGLRERRTRALLGGVAAAAAFALAQSTAVASGGGLTPGYGSLAESPPTALPALPVASGCGSEGGGFTSAACVPVRKARLIRGRAVPPLSAPAAVKAAIAAANRIRTKPYIWGGGHARWRARGYDCSGAVSYALHGGGLLDAPLTSGEMARWGAPGKGRWITIYANASHVFAVIDGLRWDTAGDVRGTGPRWHRGIGSTAGYVARHPVGF